jgi:hypothetical protein
MCDVKCNPYLVSIDQCLLPGAHDCSHFASLEENHIDSSGQVSMHRSTVNGLVVLLSVHRGVTQTLQLLNTSHSEIWKNCSINIGYIAHGTPY